MKERRINLDDNPYQNSHANQTPFKTLYFTNKEVTELGFLATVDKFTSVLTRDLTAPKSEVIELVNNIIRFANQTTSEPIFKYEIQSLGGLETILVKVEISDAEDQLVTSYLIHLTRLNPMGVFGDYFHVMNNDMHLPHQVCPTNRGYNPYLNPNVIGANPHVPGSREYFNYEIHRRNEEERRLRERQYTHNQTYFPEPHYGRGQAYRPDPTFTYPSAPVVFNPCASNAYASSDEVEETEDEAIYPETFDANESNVNETDTDLGDEENDEK